MTARSLSHGLGRPPSPGGPASLAGPVDDLVDEMKQSDTWKNMWVDAADKAYNQILTRFESDKQRLSDEIVSTAAPGLKQLAMETVTSVEPALKQDFINLFDDAETQARIGQTQDEIKSSFIQVAAVGAITTILGTWLLVRYAGGR